LTADGMTPFHPHLIGALFNDTTNSYKYYWFLAILNRVKRSPEQAIPLQELAEEMLDLVWYPLNYFKLSFGKQDQFAPIARRVSALVNPASKDSIMDQVRRIASEEEVREISRQILQLTRYVPYRFIRPFFASELRAVDDAQVNQNILNLANRYAREDPNRVPYAFGDDCIVLNQPWLDYFRENISLLHNFTCWELGNFVQKHNPNVPGISKKLFKPGERNHRANTLAWQLYYREKQPLSCIYSGVPVPPKFSLDHFLPWSFVVHDLNWNMAPVSKSVNSSKSDDLPNLDLYLPRLVDLQWDFLKFIEKTDNTRIQEHYVMLFNDSLANIAAMTKERFGQHLSETIVPQHQIASNMSFVPGWRYAGS